MKLSLDGGLGCIAVYPIGAHWPIAAAVLRICSAPHRHEASEPANGAAISSEGGQGESGFFYVKDPDLGLCFYGLLLDDLPTQTSYALSSPLPLTWEKSNRYPPKNASPIAHFRSRSIKVPFPARCQFDGEDFRCVRVRVDVHVGVQMKKQILYMYK